MIASKKDEGSGYKINIEQFTSTNELVDVCESRTKNSGFSEDKFGGEKLDKGWSGVANIDVAKGYLRGGWKDKVSDMQITIRSVERTCMAEKRVKFVDAVEGFTPIVPKAIMGLPDAMRATAMKKMKSKVVDLYYDFAFPARVSNDDIMRAGFDLMKLIVTLESKGYRVRLSVITTYSDENSADMCVVKVKSENQPLDLQRVMFPMMHTAMFRVVLFGWYERCPTSVYRSCYGKGMKYYKGEDGCRRIIREMFGEQAVYINGLCVIEDKGYLNKVVRL